MVKKTYRRFSKKGLSKKNKLRKSKRKSLRSKRKNRKHGGNDYLPCNLHTPTTRGWKAYQECEVRKVDKYREMADNAQNEEEKKEYTKKAEDHANKAVYASSKLSASE